MHARQPELDDTVGHAGEDDVRVFDMATGEGADVRAQGHADADADQAAGR
jgi:hypothetical protein